MHRCLVPNANMQIPSTMERAAASSCEETQGGVGRSKEERRRSGRGRWREPFVSADDGAMEEKEEKKSGETDVAVISMRW